MYENFRFETSSRFNIKLYLIIPLFSEYNEYNKAVYETVKKETKSIGSGFSVPESNIPHNLTTWPPFQHSV